MTATKEHPYVRWRNLKLGTHKCPKDLSLALTDAGFKVTSWAAKVLEKVTIAPAETEIELINVSVYDLGFEKEAKREEIYARAKESGLLTIPAEAGPQLRLQYHNQRMGEWLFVGMEPISAVPEVAGMSVFRVGRNNDGQWLFTGYGGNDDVRNPQDRWVFARSNQN